MATTDWKVFKNFGCRSNNIMAELQVTFTPRAKCIFNGAVTSFMREHKAVAMLCLYADSRVAFRLCDKREPGSFSLYVLSSTRHRHPPSSFESRRLCAALGIRAGSVALTWNSRLRQFEADISALIENSPFSADLIEHTAKQLSKAQPRNQKRPKPASGILEVCR